MLDNVSEMARHAEMLDNSWGFPCEVSVPSLRRTTVGCCTERAHEDVVYDPRKERCSPSAVRVAFLLDPHLGYDNVEDDLRGPSCEDYGANARQLEQIEHDLH